jgi:hypothetical protein
MPETPTPQVSPANGMKHIAFLVLLLATPFSPAATVAVRSIASPLSLISNLP